MIENVPIIAAFVALAGLSVALFYRKNDAIEIDNEKVAEITEEIQKGAMAFLTSEYRYISVFVLIVGGILFAINGEDGGIETAMAFVFGAIASVAAGFSGMRAATSANGRTAMAAKNSGQPAALQVSYSGGAVMGLSVGGLGLLAISLIAFGSAMQTLVMHTLGVLFSMQLDSEWVLAAWHCSRVGGGIYTKAADVGADLLEG